MTKILETVNGFVWGAPALVLILGVGLYLSLRTGFAQLRLFPRALRDFLGRMKPGEDSSFQALCTALAATVGIGNIAGVAGAIAIGGPGSIFWMWLCALFGMITKLAEATLAVRYRHEMEDGRFTGGPMYVICKGMGEKWRWLGGIYCFFGVVAAFGVGNATQINAVVAGITTALAAFDVPVTASLRLMLGIGLAVIVTLLLSGGAGRIGKIAELLVPFVSVAYVLLCIGVLAARWQAIPGAFASILTGAFSPRAVTGGLVGSLFAALRTGVSRGVFTNEAGMGTASIAHAAANVEHPVDQGLMGIMEVFLDTIVICTMTALAILCSGVSIPFGTDEGAVLTTRAFSAVYGDWVAVPIALFMCCFAFATVLGWGLYGARCAQFLFGTRAWLPFTAVQGIMVVLGAVLNTGLVWTLSETVNGLMAIPNLIALARLTPELVRLLNEYECGGTYENFHQRKPMRALSHEKVSPHGGGCREAGQNNLPPEHWTA